MRVRGPSWLTRTIVWREPELWKSFQFQAVHRRANVEAACRKDSDNGIPHRHLAHSYHAQLYERQMQWYTIPRVLAQEVTAYVRGLHGLLQGAHNLLLMSDICNAPWPAAGKTLHLSRTGNPQKVHALGDALIMCSVGATHVSLHSVLLLFIYPWLGKIDHGLLFCASPTLHSQTPSLTSFHPSHNQTAEGVRAHQNSRESIDIDCTGVPSWDWDLHPMNI